MKVVLVGWLPPSVNVNDKVMVCHIKLYNASIIIVKLKTAVDKVYSILSLRIHVPISAKIDRSGSPTIVAPFNPLSWIRLPATVIHTCDIQSD